MKRLRKIFLWGLLFFLLAAFVGAPLLVRTDYTQARLRQLVQDLMKDGPVSISFSSALPDVFSFVEIRDLVVSGPGGTVVSADRATLGPLLPGVLGKDRSLGRVALEGVRLHLARDAAGAWNAASWFASGNKEEDSSGRPETPFQSFPISIPWISVSDGLVRLSVEGPDGALVLDAPIQVDLSGSMEGSEIAVRKGRLLDPEDGATPATEVKFSGRWDFADDSRSQVSLDARSGSLARWQALAPGLPALQDAKARVDAKGPLFKPTVEFEASCAPGQSTKGNARLDWSGEAFSVAGEADVKGFMLQCVTPAPEGVLNGRLAFSGAVWPFLEFSATAALRDSHAAGYPIAQASFTASRSRDGQAEVTVDGDLAWTRVSLKAKGMANGLWDDKALLDMNLNGEIGGLDIQKVSQRQDAPPGILHFKTQASVVKAAGKQLADSSVTAQLEISQPSQVDGHPVENTKVKVSGARGGVMALQVNGDLAWTRVSLKAKGMASGLWDEKAPLDVDVNGEFSGLDIRKVTKRQDAPPGTLHFKTQAGVRKKAGAPLADALVNAKVEVLPSKVDNVHIDSGHIQARVSREGVTLEKGRLTGLDADILFSGAADYALQGHVAASAVISNLTAVAGLFHKEPVTGSAELEVDASGNLAKPVVRAKAHIQDGGYGDYAVREADVTLDGDVQGLTAKASIKASGVTAQGKDMDNLSLTAGLSPKMLSWEMTGSGGFLDSLAVKGTLADYQEDKKTLSLSRLEVVHQGRRLEMQDKALAVFTPQGIGIPGLSLLVMGQPVRVEGRYGYDGAIKAQVEAPNLDLHQAASQLGLATLPHGKGQVSLRAGGSLKKPSLILKAQVEHVYVREDVPEASAALEARYENGAASVTAEVIPESGGSLEAAASLPMALGYPLAKDWLPQSGLEASIQGKSLGLSFAAQWVEGLEELRAVLDMEGTVSGDPRNPAMTGAARLLAKKVVLKAWDEPLTGVEADLAWNPRQLTIRNFTARTQKEGRISVSGTVDMDNIKPGRVDVTCKAENLDAAHGGMIKARTGADLKVSGTWPAIDVTGAVDVGEGEFRLDRFMETRRRQVSVEKDIRIVGEEAPAGESPFTQVKAAVDLRVNGPFWIRGEGAQTEVGGVLAIAKARGSQAPALTGYMETKRGVYEFKGKNFNIDKGRLDFVGVRPPDPLLDIRCSYKVGGATIYLDIGGRPSAMTLTLSSDMGLDQTDIASLLLFGKKASELTNGEAKSMEDRGAAILGARALDEIKKVIGREVPLDVLSVENGGQGVANDLVLGKYLSPKLFITYRRQMSAAGSNQVQLEYQLTPKISVESQIGESESGVDLFWSYDY